MPSSSIGSTSVILLLGLLYLQAHTVDATISTSAGFPHDVFAKPAFEIHLGKDSKDAASLPIKRSHALEILEQQQASSSTTSGPASPSASSYLSSSLAVPGARSSHSDSPQQQKPGILFWQLERSSPHDFQLCSIPNFTFKPTDKHASRSTPTSSRSRQDLLRHAQTLLEPLKNMCLYHTLDWFTYSFCYGREIRQFRQLAPRIAAERAFKTAGGGKAGEQAALEAATKVKNLPYPVHDPLNPAFILGRWNPANDEIAGDDTSHQRHQQQPLSDHAQASTVVSTQLGMGSPSDSGALDLVEEVQFGDWDEEELFAAEAKALAHVQGSPTSAVENSRDANIVDGNESQRHRYLTQRWTNGTMCDMNHQPRTVEVQYHCSNRKPAEDRIVMFKETTICNYVLVIDTPRLCADPAFGSEKEEAPLPIQCHKVVDDNYAGPTVGDPEKVEHPLLSELDAQQAASDPAEPGAHDASTSSDEASKTSGNSHSHTYGDLSRYGSIHDDFYDEATGGRGALYESYEHGHDPDHEHDHSHDHDHDHDGEVIEAEVMVEIGVDENGKPFVNRIGSDHSKDGAGTRRRENGKKRSADDSDSDSESDKQPLGIQLDAEDLLSVLRGDQGGSFEQKLAEKISEALSSQMQLGPDERDNAPDAAAAGAGAGKQNHANTRGGVGKPSMHKQSPPLKMAKVGDSLSERVKRLYDAKQRKDKQKTQDIPNPDVPAPAPELAEHLEL